MISTFELPYRLSLLSRLLEWVDLDPTRFDYIPPHTQLRNHK